MYQDSKKPAVNLTFFLQAAKASDETLQMTELLLTGRIMRIRLQDTTC